MKVTVVGLVVLVGCSGSSSPAIDSGSQPTVDAAGPVDPLAGIGQVTEVASLSTPPQGSTPFLEGPVWNVGAQTLLFTDIPNSTIHQLTLPASVSEFRIPSGQANGLAFDSGGLLLAAEHQGRRLSRTNSNGDVAALAELFEGKKLHSPNDLVVAGDGTIYFTDPPYGGNPAELDFNGLFRIAPGGQLSAEVRYPEGARPNGVGLSPDGARLYLADTTGVLFGYDVGSDGALSGEQILDDQRVAGADGMAIDRDGNLWLTTNDGIDVFAADGEHLGTVSVPKKPANCAFGGPNGTTLFITARDTLYRVEVQVRGLGL